MDSGPAFVVGDLLFPLSRHRMVLGRADPSSGWHPEIDLAPLGQGRSISRRHAQVDRNTDGFFVVHDLGSALGTYVNGEMIEEGTHRRLGEQDTVTIGAVTLTFEEQAPWPPGVVAEWAEEALDAATTQSKVITGELPLISQLPRALRRGNLLLHYQPQVELATGRVRAVEALIRWSHPERGIVHPDEFVPGAEKTGFIRNLTTFAIEAAAAQAREWQRINGDIQVSINVSVRDVEDPGFVDRIGAAVDRGGVDSDHVLLEITESGLMLHKEVALDTLGALKDAGFRLGIDDFGAGHSSYAYLADLPVDEVKTDRVFARELSPANEAIIGSIVNLVHDLGMIVTIEGIETAEVADKARAIGCDRGQGYFFGKPVVADKLDLSPIAEW